MRTGLCMLALLLASCLWAQDYVEDFEQGLGGAASYHPAPDALTVALGTNAPASGRQYARAALPGKKPLEGFFVTATGLTGARLATVTAQVRGQGELWLCLISGNGWLYSPQTVALTDQWQEVSLSKVLVARDKSLGIYFISRTPQTGAVYEVDNVRVRLAASPQTYDAPVGPWRLEAEDYAPRTTYVRAQADALGGKTVANDQYAVVTDLPFPRTSQPVTIYARVRSGSPGDSYSLTTRQGGNAQYLQSLKPGQRGQWEWVRFAPAVAGEVGDTFSFTCLREKESAGDTAVDSLVLATDSSLTPEQLAATPVLCGRRPLALVAKTSAPPTVDGKADDACWQNTVACGSFMIVGSNLSAQAATHVRLCYDDRNLYAVFQCAEPILNTAQQRRHEFVAKVTQRDGEVYSDDSVIMLLDPSDSGREAYDLTVNALGTIADARDHAPDLWETRDLKWNSQAVAAGQVGEDLWTVEIAIPFAALGQTPRAGDCWQASLGRIAKARQETSSWNLSNKGFHDPVEFGTLVFGDTAPGVAATVPPSLQLGSNQLSVALTPVPGRAQGVYLVSELHSAPDTRRVQTYHDLSDKPQTVSQRFDLGAEPEVRIGHAVLEAATLKPLYVTPSLARAVKSSVATLKLTAAGPYELFVNGELVASGAAARGTAIKAPLQKGANVFVLKLAQGTAAVRLEASGTASDGSAWKLAPADAKAPTAVATDDGAWPPAAKTADDPQLGPVVGLAGQPVVLRTTLLWEKTRVWPTPDPAFYLARGAAQHLTFVADGFKGRKLREWTTYVAVPPEFEVTGSTGFYGTARPTQPQFRCTPLGTQQIGGKPMRVAKITADKPLASGQHPIMSQFEVFVRYREESGEPTGAETQFVYWSEAEGGSLREAPQTIKVRLLPKLRGAQCQTLVWQLWGGWFSNVDDEQVRGQILECARLSGFNDLVSGDRWTSDNAPRQGLRHTMGTNFEPWCMDLGPYLKAHPDQRLLQAEGKPHEGHMCMTLLLGEGWPAVEAALRARLTAVRPNVVDYDYEFAPYNGPHSCYCPRCLQAFREEARLGAEVALTPETIKQQYSPQWVDFMARRVARMYAKLTKATHAFAPGTLFSVYSGYQTADNPERYGIDWRYIGEYHAVDRAGAGYGRPLEAINATLAALQGIPLLGGACLVPYELEATNPQTPLTKAWLLRVLLDSTGGVLVYDRLTFDGRSWYAMAETTRLAAKYEAVFLKGKRTALPGQDPAQVQVVSDGTTSLLCVLNQGSKAASFKVVMPAVGREYYSGNAVAAAQTVTVSLPPGETAIYVLGQ